MTDRLVIIPDRYTYRIGWICDGEEGAMLGEDKSEGIGATPAKRDDWELWASNKIAREAKAERDGRGFYWESKSEASAVLKAIQLQFKNADRPLPEWAKLALDAGWKPPKGWKP